MKYTMIKIQYTRDSTFVIIKSLLDINSSKTQQFMEYGVRNPVVNRVTIDTDYRITIAVVILYIT